MSNFLVSYDLHNKRNYQPLYDALERLGAVRILESVWLLSTSMGAGELREHLRQFIDGDDSLVVIELLYGADWSAVRVKKTGSDFLQKNVKAY